MSLTYQTHTQGRTDSIQISKNGTQLSTAEVLEGWSNDESFRSFYTTILKGNQYPAFFWENPPRTVKNINLPHEFVLVKGDRLLNIEPNREPFEDHFLPDLLVSTFKNLGGDAELIVPKPMDKTDDYAHLKKFIERAPDEQIDDFWKTVGNTYKSALCDDPKWLSTAGLGVSWLHIRIDSVPKYYRHYPFRSV